MRTRGPWLMRRRSGCGPRILAAAALFTATAAAEPDLPHVHLDPERRFVEIDAEVIGPDADWLELLVCTAGGREHEALLRTPALPSHVNLGLLLLGLEPGRPAHTGPDGVFLPAEGPPVRLTIRSPDNAFEPADAGTWLLDRDAGETLAGASWRYTGSRVLADAAGPVFLADANGTLASLVSFGDDLILLDLARAAGLDAGNDGQRFAASAAVPPAGTAVRLRIEAVAFDTGPAAPDTPVSSPARPVSPASPQDADP